MADMIDLLPNVKGFSPTNLRYMMRFYDIYNDALIVPQIDEQRTDADRDKIVPQVGEQFMMATNRVFLIPWGHIKLLIKMSPVAEKSCSYAGVYMRTERDPELGWIYRRIAEEIDVSEYI